LYILGKRRHHICYCTQKRAKWHRSPSCPRQRKMLKNIQKVKARSHRHNVHIEQKKTWPSESDVTCQNSSASDSPPSGAHSILTIDSSERAPTPAAPNRSTDSAAPTWTRALAVPNRSTESGVTTRSRAPAVPNRSTESGVPTRSRVPVVPRGPGLCVVRVVPVVRVEPGTHVDRSTLIFCGMLTSASCLP